VLADGLGVPCYGCGPGPGFLPDVEIGDGDVIAVGDTEAVAVHTPGHSPDHLCYRVDDALFSGDHVIDGSTVIVEHMADYMDSLHRVRRMNLQHIYPGHGEVINNPAAVLDAYIVHRMRREEQILEAVRDGARTLGEVVLQVYTDVDPALHGAAAISVGAHLRRLIGDGLVVAPMGTDEWAARVSPAPPPRGK
jgi:glyoxylase-like metal-dependent hydrolase (beta-lactamase superfamily II)